MSVREKVRSYDERNGENAKMPLRVICKLVSTGLYCACPPADIVPLIHFSRHNSVPRVPAIPGLKSFPGMVMQSHDYRYPEIFQGMDVVILGAAASGADICLHVARCAKRVYLRHNGTALVCSLPDSVTQCRPIKSVSSDGTVMFDDGWNERERSGFYSIVILLFFLILYVNLFIYFLVTNYNKLN